MIHAQIDGAKNITGYEVGNRQSFDTRHGGDPLWVFLDYDIIQYHVRRAEFLLYPQHFYLDTNGDVQLHTNVTLFM